jgi:hypothetical protein
MTWDEYERLIYREVVYRQRYEKVMAAIGEAIGNRSSCWDGWPGTSHIARYVMGALAE